MVDPYARYRATVQEKVGRFRLTVSLDIDIVEHDAPRRLIAREWARSPSPEPHEGGTRPAPAEGGPAEHRTPSLHDCDPFYGPAFKGHPVPAMDRVCYAGEPVAAVIAETKRQATAVLALLEVRLLELPAALSVGAALAPEAPLAHETLRLAGHFHDLARLRPVPGTNVCPRFTYTRGDIEQGFTESDAVFEDTFRLPPISHYAMQAAYGHRPG